MQLQFPQPRTAQHAHDISKPKIALVGAAGAIGQGIATALESESTPYRVVGRSSASLQKGFGAGLHPLSQIRTWDPEDSSSVQHALEGIETIIYLVGVNYWEFQLHPILMQKTLAGAELAGVRRMLLIGTVYPYGKPLSAIVTEDHPRLPHTFKGKMRKEQEDLLFAAHSAGTIQACELRLPDFYGPDVEKSFLWSAFQAAKSGGKADMVGPIDILHQFVYVPDVGPIVTGLLHKDKAWGHIWQYAGSGSITQREFAEKIFRAAGTQPRLRVAGKLMLRFLGLIKPFLRELVEMHYLLTDPILLEDSRLCRLLGAIDRTPYDVGIAKTLEAIPEK